MTCPAKNHFYVTLFSNASRDIYEQNTYADFIVNLAQFIHLGFTSNFEVGFCEFPCSSSPERVNPVLLYPNMIFPQCMDDSTVHSIRTFHP